MKASSLIYDWNDKNASPLAISHPVLLNDETLRDGLQSPSVRDPSIGEKIQILHLMEALGINFLDLGLPGAGPRAVEHVEALAREISNSKLKIRANCAARTHENDIRPIAEIVQRTGLSIEAATFIGSSPIRRYTENWTDDFLLQTTEKAVKYAVSLGLDVMYVTEDTTRCDPETVKRLYSIAIDCGAHAIVICDTVGHSTPMGTYALVRFVLDEVVKPSGEKDSRGLARTLRSGIRHRKLDGCTARGGRLRPRMCAWNRRTGREHADGPDAGELETDGCRALGVTRPHQIERLLPGGV